MELETSTIKRGGCIFKTQEGDIYQFSPLAPVTNEFINWYIEKRNIQLCRLYYPPFNFERTGCNACPYNVHVGRELSTLKNILPNTYKQAWIIWRPVLEEYQRLNYRRVQDVPNPFEQENNAAADGLILSCHLKTSKENEKD